MKKMLIVSIFGNPDSDDNSRINSIYDYAEADRMIITADFDHTQKKYRKLEGKRNVHLLHVPAYKKNLSLRRIFSHIVFGLRLKAFFNKHSEKPDIIYCAMPASFSAFVCGRYCKKKGIRFVIDVIDLWPDSLLPVSKLYRMLRFLLYPWKYITVRAYKYANIILGESKKYAGIAHKYNPYVPCLPVYLGIDMGSVRRIRSESDIKLEKTEGQIWICYAGSLGSSYDFDSLLEAVKMLHGFCDYRMLFIGGGENQKYIEKKIEEHELNGMVTGQVSYGDYLKYLSYCDIGINTFREGTLVVHSYKFNDYVASDLFILNNLKGETEELVDKYKIGLNFNYSDRPLGVVLKEVCMNWHSYKEYKENNIHFRNNELDKNTIYPAVLSEILK